MAVPRAQIRVHRYVPGWREAALHHRCQGSYVGTACRSRHRLAQAAPSRDTT